MRVAILPSLFTLPRLRSYDGYAVWQTILLRRADATDDLLAHELCHIWQIQQRPLPALVAWLRGAKEENPFEVEERRVVELTR